MVAALNKREKKTIAGNVVKLKRLNRGTLGFKIRKQFYKLTRLYYKSPLYAVFH
jgi:hypothetical protein